MRVFSVLAFVFALGLGYAFSLKFPKTPGAADSSEAQISPLEKVTLASQASSAKDLAVPFWPPTKGLEYPDLVLEDSNGATVRLSDFAGRVILVELVAIPCKGCQAFAGGKRLGGYGGVTVQPGLDSIHDYCRQIASVDLASHPEVVFVQLLLYGKAMGRPTAAETRGWAAHFKLDQHDNQIVLRGDASMLNSVTRDMIPGFQLIDRNFVLRSDSCGHHPSDNLYSQLLPELRKIVKQPLPSRSGRASITTNPFFQ